MQKFVMRRAGVLAAASLSLVVVAACASTASTPPPAPTTAPTSAPPIAPTSAAVPTLNGVATSLPTTSPTIAPTTAPTAASSANADAVTLMIDPAASKASYHAHEQLVGKTLPTEAVGSSGSVIGALVIGADGSIVADQSKISVDLSKLQSDESRRDNFIKGNTLQTSRYPMATFVPREVLGLPSPLPTSGQVTFQLLGDLTVHGVTKPVTWQVSAQFGDTSVTGDATSTINITDFGMTPPKAGPVLSIEDGLTLELAFTAARQA